MTSPLLTERPALRTPERKPIGRNPIWLILAFLLPFLGMWAAFIVCEVHPFGDMQILYSDLRAQYYPFLQEFHQRVQLGDSLLWSWNGGMGTDFISLIAYYIASPLNLLTIFFPLSALRDVMTLLLTVKIGCAGLFFAIMLRSIFRKNDISITMFGWMFAFCSFIMGYYWDIIWMDTVALLPLVFLGLYKLVTEGKFRLYVIALALAVFSNYYIGFFICLFCVIAFFAIAAIRNVYGRPFLGRLLQFGGCSLLGGGLTAFLLLHTGIALTYTDSASGMSSLTPEFYDSYLDVIGNMLAFNSPTAMEGLPNLYCGVLPLLLVAVYLLSKKISIGDKIINVSFLAFFIFSSNFNILDFVLHGFRFPNMLPGRYTFLVSFVLLIVGYRGFLLLKELSEKQIFGIAALGIVTVGLSCFSLGTVNTMANVILIAAYLLFLFLYFRRFINKRILTAFLCVLITGEMIASVTLSMDKVGKTSYPDYPYKYEKLVELNDTLEDLDPGFWRTEMSCRYYLNDGCMYDYRGISQFSSTANRNVTKFISAISFTTGANSYYYNFSSPLNNSLLGLKYITTRGDSLLPGTKTEQYYTTEDFKVYRNTAFAGMGFMVSEDITEMQYTNSPFQVQNRLFRSLTGVPKDIFFSLPTDADRGHYDHFNFDSLEKKGSEYAFTTSDQGTLDLYYTALRDGTYYAYMNVSGGGGKISVSVNHDGDVSRNNVALNDLRYIGPVCTAKAGDAITVSVTVNPADIGKTKSGNISFYLYRFAEDAFDEGWAEIEDETWNPTDFSDTHLKGEINVLQDGLFCTLVPYTEDWVLYVDGMEAETFPMLGGDMVRNGEISSTLEGPFLGTRLPSGMHTVELRYQPKGLTAGIVISLVCLAALIALCIIFPKGFPTFKDPEPEKDTPEENELPENGTEKSAGEEENHESNGTD